MKPIFILLSSLLVLWGCTTENNPTFKLTTTVSPVGSGTILPTKTTFNKGETAVVQAIPNAGWRFVHWQGGLTGTNNPANVLMSIDKHIIGVFEQSNVTDIDGNVYITAKIGNQIWMAANLKTTRFRNGESIALVSSNGVWMGNNEGSLSGVRANYNNNPANNVTYGQLYNWYTASSSKGLCPTGWHLPSDAEWTVMSNFLGSDVGSKMKSTSGWSSGGNGSNASGFNALPGGFRDWWGGFSSVGSYGAFWSSAQSNSGSTWARTLNSDNNNLNRTYDNQGRGHSVRCIRD